VTPVIVIVVALHLVFAALFLTRWYNLKVAPRRRAGAAPVPAGIQVQSLEPALEYSDVKRVLVGTHLYKRVLHQIPPDEKPIRVTRLHWLRMLWALPLIYLMLVFVNGALFRSNLDKYVGWPSISSTSSSKHGQNAIDKAVGKFIKSEKKAIDKSARQIGSPKHKKHKPAHRKKHRVRKRTAKKKVDQAKKPVTAIPTPTPAATPVNNRDKLHLFFPTRKVYLFLALAVLAVILFFVNPFAWIWTVWVITDQNYRRLLLPPSWVPMGLVKNPLPVSEVRGTAIAMGVIGRILKVGTVTPHSKVENTPEKNEPMDPIRGLPDPEGFADDLSAASKAFRALHPMG
jgi:hypothetical protein